MVPLDVLRSALRSLRTHKLRTWLSMLGVMIGVMAVIVLVALGRGSQQAVTKSIADLGTSSLTIMPGNATASQRSVGGRADRQVVLTYEDALALANPATAPAVLRVAPEVTTSTQAVAGGQHVKAQVVGTTPEYQPTRNLKLARGEFLKKEHLQARTSVAVLGATTARALFGGADPLGQTVRLRTNDKATVLVRVIGVLQPQGGGGFGSEDELIVVPYTVLAQRLANQRTVRGEHQISQITVQVVSEDKINEATEQIRSILRRRHRVPEDDFTVQNQLEALAALGQTGMILGIFLGIMAGISLLVGGIGIMNIMLVSVTERTREIGLRLAVGAEPRHIIVQFLSEAVMVSGGGGLLGILIGIGVVALASQVQVGDTGLPVVLQPDAVILAFAVSVAVGLFFGLYPAAKASQLDPVQALRTE
jgi:putative ABC transport system permease protein